MICVVKLELRDFKRILYRGKLWSVVGISFGSNKMKALVTGGGGFIGTNLIKR